jgi:hypothetical protein
MTDNEIIKALECCLKNLCHCRECPRFQRGVDDCHVTLYNDVLDLINRQKTEIERFEKENREQFSKWMRLDKRTKERYAELCEEAKGVVRAEAIKEFAARLKAAKFKHKNFGELVYVDDIDNLVKEMTEESQ